ncbi:MAG TPA: hypothetical protein VGX91_02790, partial [Candidatus Cybelea sp.]|nr:hypothetical protein [Candidatus Cybelea sp.]
MIVAAVLALFVAACSLRGPLSSAAGDTAMLPSAHGKTAPRGVGIAFLLTDGTVLAQDENPDSAWFRLSPDIRGSYEDGTWTQVGSLPTGYAPDAYASQMLADGRLVIIGGEYNNPRNHHPLQLTNLGAIFDPQTNAWTALGHPTGWDWVGDSPSTILPDGRMLLGQKLTKRDAVLDPTTLQWTEVSDAGKADFNAEEGWTLLPNGNVLTADVRDAPNSEIYNPSAGRWRSIGATAGYLRSPYFGKCIRYGNARRDCYPPPGEIGPAVLRPHGTKGPLAGKWAGGPDLPVPYGAGDTYAVLTPAGDVLLILAGGLWLFNGTTYQNVEKTVGSPLLLPTGQLILLGIGTAFYTPPGKPQERWRPTISSCPPTII